jgi:general stress protein YciG
MAKKQQSKGKQGFASMDEEKQREIASKGGRTSHKGEEPDTNGDVEDEDNENEGKGKQGFASMDKEKVREIASKGGKASHRGASDDEDESEDEDSENQGKGKQGFASMDKEKVREIASKGGKASHRGASDDEDEQQDEEDGVSEKIYSLIDILQEDLTAVDVDTATAAIDEWYQQLKGSKNKDLKQIATNLKNLRKVVTSEEADESEIAEILISIGEQIGEYASNADENISDPLQELSAVLIDAGDSLE